jgi:hypothetical protein
MKEPWFIPFSEDTGAQGIAEVEFGAQEIAEVEF